ncbi:MAG TPA: tRNA uracil 4-sulfurtransferase ThiI [Dehalococcoidia bacterium]|nr:tRNA uracil 4-sulfurtransferase ThiI [Dehalococcoidia bacterium]
MKTHVIVKTHELALKGKNRPWFMRKLVDNLRKATQGTEVQAVWQGHMLAGLTLADEAAWPAVAERVKDCFGVAKFFMAYEVPPSLDSVMEALPALLEGRSFESFRITANRADKRFPVNSEQINRDLGTFVKDLSGARVDLRNPGLEIFLDVQPKGILLYFHAVAGYGGLPVGVSGDVMTMLSGGIDSPVAAWQMMKRGCRAHFVHFHSYPLVDMSSMEKVDELVQLLTRHQYGSSLFLVPLAEIQKQIIVATPPAYRVIMYRRFMVRIAEALALRHGAKAIVTGESCGQVSSQTLDNIGVIDRAVEMTILRPLVGFNKEEIVTVARGIGTFPISIQPDQDCCSLFVPKHPETRAKLENVCRLEGPLAVDDLVQDALARTERKEFTAFEIAG